MNNQPPPHSPEAEQSFLSTLFTEPDRMKGAEGRVTPNDLYVEHHRVLYRAMRRVWAARGDLDLVLVMDELTDQGNLERARGKDYITRTVSAAPSALNHDQYADRILELSRKRKLLGVLEDKAQALRNKKDESFENAAKDLETNLRELGDAGDTFDDTPEQLAVPPEDVAEWLNGQPPKREALLTTGGDESATFLVRGKTAMLVAPGGGGKTGLLAQLAVAVATGTPWLGYDVARPGRVLLALGEEDRAEMHRRIHYAFDAQQGAAADDLATNLVPFPLYATNPRFIEHDPMGRRGDSPTPSLFYRRLYDYLENNGPWALIIIDPASRFMGAEVETDNAAATRFVELLEAMTQVEGAPTVLTAHHTNKGALNAEKTNQGAARGSSALVDGVRWCANLELVSDPDELDEDRLRDWRRLRVVKTNYTERPAPMTLRYDGRWVPVDESEKRLREESLEELDRGEGKAKTKGRPAKYEGAKRVI